MQDSAAVNSSCVMRPPRTSSDICQTPVPEPICLPRKCPVSIGPAGDADGGQVAARRAHEQRGRGLVAAHEQHDAVDRIAADRLLDVHAGEIAEQHRGGTQLRFTQRHHGKFQRKAAGFIDATLHELRQLAEVPIAGSQLPPGVADADDRAAIEHVVGIALVLDPAAMQEAVFPFSAEPVLTAALALFWNVHRAPAYKAQTYASNSFLIENHTSFGMVVAIRRDHERFFMSSAQP